MKGKCLDKIYFLLHSCFLTQQFFIKDLSKVSQVKGVRFAPRLKFLESEPKKCKPSPSCPLAHQDKTILSDFFGKFELVLFVQYCCSSVCPQTTALNNIGASGLWGRHPGQTPTCAGPDQNFFFFLGYATTCFHSFKSQ